MEGTRLYSTHNSCRSRETRSLTPGRRRPGARIYTMDIFARARQDCLTLGRSWVAKAPGRLSTPWRALPRTKRGPLLQPATRFTARIHSSSPHARTHTRSRISSRDPLLPKRVSHARCYLVKSQKPEGGTKSPAARCARASATPGPPRGGEGWRRGGRGRRGWPASRRQQPLRARPRPAALTAACAPLPPCRGARSQTARPRRPTEGKPARPQRTLRRPPQRSGPSRWWYAAPAAGASVWVEGKGG